MKRLAAMLLFVLAGNIAGHAQQDDPPGKARDPRFLALNLMNGFVLPTNNYILNEGGPKRYSAFSLKYGILSHGNECNDIAYGMPYGGIGIYAARFGKHEGRVGSPVSLFVFQGGSITRLSQRFSFNYEWNLGMSFGWLPYDPFDNPLNIAIGSAVNVHVGFDLYVKWYLNRTFDINIGVNAAHFSNGASRLPNAGFNLVTPSVALVYNFNRNGLCEIYDPALAPPSFRKRIDHEVAMIISSRQSEFDTTGTNLPSRYVDRKFKVLGANYAMLFVNNYNYKWGPALNFVYDESSGAHAWRQLNLSDMRWHDRIKLGRPSERVSLGISARGELTMQRYSIFANVGWNMIWGNRDDTRLYQILGLKIYLSENFFGTFGIRASHFSAAQYLYWSLGYTIGGRYRAPGKKMSQKPANNKNDYI